MGHGRRDAADRDIVRRANKSAHAVIARSLIQPIKSVLDHARAPAPAMQRQLIGRAVGIVRSMPVRADPWLCAHGGEYVKRYAGQGGDGVK